MDPATIKKVCEILASTYPVKAKGLERHETAYTLLVTCMMSAQTRDGVTEGEAYRLLYYARTPEEMVKLSKDEIAKMIEKVRFPIVKAENILKASQKLIDDHAGEVPLDRENLEALPGVGRKTSNIMRNVVGGENFIAVDSHVFRVCTRIGISNGKNAEQVSDDLENVIPDHMKKDAHAYLIVHGRWTCKTKNPECGLCSVKTFCEFIQ